MQCIRSIEIIDDQDKIRFSEMVGEDARMEKPRPMWRGDTREHMIFSCAHLLKLTRLCQKANLNFQKIIVREHGL